MKRLCLAILILIAVSLSGCAGQESAIPAAPTPVSTYTPFVPTATPAAPVTVQAASTRPSQPSPTATPTAEPTATPTVEPTATATAEPTATPTVVSTATATAEPTATEEPSPAPGSTPEPDLDSGAAVTGTTTLTATESITVSPGVTPTVEITATQDPAPGTVITAGLEISSQPGVSQPVTPSLQITPTERVGDAGDGPSQGAEGAGEDAEVPADGEPGPEGRSRAELLAGLPAEIAALLADGDESLAQVGSQLVVEKGCIACHSMEEGIVMVGPSWYNLAGRAGTRVPDQGPALYLYTSIVNPNEYVVEGFLPNLMLQTYGETLSDAELAQIIGYLLTLTGE